jgi:hypothetical protein
MRLLIFVLLSICLSAVGQNLPNKNVHTEAKYTVAGKSLRVQNSYPKGGGRYTDPNGIEFGYVILWTSVVNESDTPVQLSINFPNTPFTLPPSPDSYLKIFLPSQIMTHNKESLFDYGVTDLKSFLDANHNKPTTLLRMINPKEEYMFYVGILFHAQTSSTRTALVVKDQTLYYKVNHLDPELIPCGKLVFNK